MIKIFKLNKENINHCINLIFCNKEDFDYFQQIGWSKKQYLNQIDKKIDYSFGISKNKKIIGFIIGDLINVEKKSEYEILLIYIEKKLRYKGYATFLIKKIIKLLSKQNLKTIFLEVSEKNIQAISFYEKNKFIRVGYRHGYYKRHIDKKENAIIYVKNINE